MNRRRLFLQRRRLLGGESSLRRASSSAACGFLQIRRSARRSARLQRESRRSFLINGEIFLVDLEAVDVVMEPRGLPHEIDGLGFVFIGGA